MLTLTLILTRTRTLTLTLTLAQALADGGGFSRLCGRGSRKGGLCVGTGACGASESLANCAWAKGIYEHQVRAGA